MKNHKRTCFKDDGSFDTVINEMHNAQNKDALSEAYYKYINLCIAHGYSDGYIIGGIMQNEAKNKEFSVNIDSVIKSLIEIKYTTVKLAEPVISANKEEEKPVKQESVSEKIDEAVGGIKFTGKVINKINNKIKYANDLVSKIESNQSENNSSDVEKIKSIVKETKEMIVSVNPTSCSEDEIASLNDSTAALDNIDKKITTLSVNNTVKDANSKQSDNKPVEQSAAAHSVSGFNINNFIKQNQQPIKGPDVSATAPQQPKPTAFPHEICGLTDDQIVEEVGKHFKVFEQLNAYPLYDLINNRLLARKMKEFGAKQRANNPFLTQVNINEYIDVPELLEKYTLCFTIPCNDKKQVIVVLFNPTAVPDKNGVLQYPLHILKAAKVNDNK